MASLHTRPLTINKIAICFRSLSQGNHLSPYEILVDIFVEEYVDV